ncbi:MAG TPA: XisI protein [Leptolyngbyaceae cyanobacterium]
MENLEKYRAYIQEILVKYANRSSSNEGVEAQTIFDTKHDHYQLIYVGWHNRQRVYGPVLHLDIKDGKIWIQWNGTEDDIGNELVEMGVPKQDIVVGFHPPYMRQFTEYGVD